jgi:TPR repeat protein
VGKEYRLLIAKKILRSQTAPEVPASKSTGDDEFKMGMSYELGTGFPQDFTKAVESFIKAAGQGNIRAQAKAGTALYMGHGISQDYIKAVKWFRLAADQGDAEAQAGLGVCFFRGEGVPQDLVESYRWLNLAAVAGDRLYVQFRDLVVSKMTPAQVAEGQKLTREWALTPPR